MREVGEATAAGLASHIWRSAKSVMEAASIEELHCGS
ncbi:hypothetical protein [Streptomyces sp. P9-1]